MRNIVVKRVLDHCQTKALNFWNRSSDNILSSVSVGMFGNILNCCQTLPVNGQSVVVSGIIS